MKTRIFKLYLRIGARVKIFISNRLQRKMIPNNGFQRPFCCDLIPGQAEYWSWVIPLHDDAICLPSPSRGAFPFLDLEMDSKRERIPKIFLASTGQFLFDQKHIFPNVYIRFTIHSIIHKCFSCYLVGHLIILNVNKGFTCTFTLLKKYKFWLHNHVFSPVLGTY